MKRLLILLSLLLLPLTGTFAQSEIVKDFTPVCDSLSRLILERTSIEGKLELKSVMKRSSALDFHFTESLGDYPWHKEDVQWFREQLKHLFPEKYSQLRLGEIYSRRVSLEKLATPHLNFNGKPAASRLKVRNHETKPAIVTVLDGERFEKGLTGRHIALWQSHGRYYEHKFQRWEWQRACLYRTVEDMFTQSFVLPYLVPMLENSGAYTLLPRERDLQTHEIIVDNDPLSGGRGEVTCSENGSWSNAGEGFADIKPTYTEGENPFSFGTARKARCIPAGKKASSSNVIWRPEIPQTGEYAVYISYKTLPESTTAACYTVVHAGGEKRFAVNQKMGGGTWIYLGTFPFEKGNKGHVSLDSRTPKGWRYIEGSVVTADAVRFGGGIGNIARGDVSPETSGMPRSAEGARYWLQWAGSDTTVYSQNGGIDDYKDDFMCRGDWVGELSGGSAVNPGQKGRGIPVDLSLGFHTDAGVTPNDSTIGTLAIYTLKSEGKTVYPNGEDRMASRELADLVQSQVVRDLRLKHDPEWGRRSIWDRGYRESRTPPVPSMILELLSHQNFADMRYGLDPEFRFTASRAVYKGILKYLSNRYGCDYAVQPLPVRSMAVEFTDNNKALVSWIPVKDSLETTADAEGYILETRIDDGCFDSGIRLDNIRHFAGRICTKVSIEPGHIYSFRIRAYNHGGKSFPSETVSIGIPLGDFDKKILIINNFDRISAPLSIDMPEYAGFTDRDDSGVPYVQDILYIGEMYQYRRGLEWKDDENPGSGASYCDYAGKTVAGNTFDFPYIHGKAILKAGYPFFSCSKDAFCEYGSLCHNLWSIDMICGKQVTTIKGGKNGKSGYTIFTPQIQEKVRQCTSKGVNLMVSGSYIGTDIWDSVYDFAADSTFKASSILFAEEVLGYRWSGGHASRRAEIKPYPNATADYGKAGIISYCNTLNPDRYCVESPDGLIPSTKNGNTVMRYSDTGISAGVCTDFDTYRTACFGFPIETLSEDMHIDSLISITLDYFEKR